MHSVFSVILRINRCCIHSGRCFNMGRSLKTSIPLLPLALGFTQIYAAINPLKLTCPVLHIAQYAGQFCVLPLSTQQWYLAQLTTSSFWAYFLHWPPGPPSSSFPSAIGSSFTAIFLVTHLPDFWRLDSPGFLFSSFVFFCSLTWWPIWSQTGPHLPH